MKYLVLITITFFIGNMANAVNDYCIEKADINTVEFFYGNLLKVRTSGPEYILMIQDCDDLAEANHFELRSVSEDNLSICNLDSVILHDSKQNPYDSCLITEILKEEQ